MILLDLLMPEMDGVAVMQQARQLGLGSKMILSSSLDDERVLAAVRARRRWVYP